MKPRYKRRIAWSIVSIIVAMALAVVIVPPMISLNYLKPKLETVINQQTGYNAKIDGNVNFSLVGGATIVAHDIVSPKGVIKSALFSVPLTKIFDLESAPLTGGIMVYGANLEIESLVPPKYKNLIEIRDSIFEFKNKEYEVVQGTLDGGMLTGVIRTNQHKYEFDSNGDQFHIKNNSNNLDITGNLYSDGSAHGTLSISTDNVNEWFDFREPKINGKIELTMDIDWNGSYGFKFSNIQGDNFSGQIELTEEGKRYIDLHSEDMDFDFSFLMGPTGIFYNTTFNLDFWGNLKFADRVFKHIQIDATGNTSDIQIRRIIADDIIISGGIINSSGAIGMPMSLPFDNKPTYCLFSGTPESWICSDFVHGNLRGSLSVKDNTFEIFVTGDTKMPPASELIRIAKLLAPVGVINFQFTDTAGTLNVTDKQSTPSYTFAKDRTLDWLGADLYFLPESMRTAHGDFTWGAYGMTFTPYSKRWTLDINKNSFLLTGKNYKEWLPNIDLQSLNDYEYTVSGNFNKNSISNLEIRIAGHLFTGTANDNTITLKTDLLNIDSFTNQNYIDNYDQLQFLTADPLLIPFSIGANISLTATNIIYNGDEYANFVYSLRDNTQSFSISDTQRGNMLTSISKDQNRYTILLQLNQFVTAGPILETAMPLNIADTTITGQATLATSGQIAYDIWYNMAGKVDLSFEGGYLIGMGMDNFYASAPNLSTLNGELMLAAALENGVSTLKSLHIVGDYDGGNFITTQPFELALPHIDASGFLMISDGSMSGNINMILRGTSPAPAPISLELTSDGRRNYSLSQIMINFDPDYFRDFVKTHDRF